MFPFSLCCLACFGYLVLSNGLATSDAATDYEYSYPASSRVALDWTPRRHDIFIKSSKARNPLLADATDEADEELYQPLRRRQEDYLEYPIESKKHKHYHQHRHHKVMKVEHHEPKEMSFVYPVLLALLILGALFVPFISLFFFLAVSAFNCNGIGAGFSQVTPVLGRRRKRRSADLLTLSPRATNSTAPAGQQQVLRKQSGSVTWDELALLVLFDSLDELTSGYSAAAGEYEFWRKQLARSTVSLAEALVGVDSWLSSLD